MTVVPYYHDVCKPPVLTYWNLLTQYCPAD